jgi:trypsin
MIAPQRNGRIIGGDYATEGQFPYQIGLYIDGSGFCGGSLISADTVLTAAHCSTG